VSGDPDGMRPAPTITPGAPTRAEAELAMRALDVYRDVPPLVERFYAHRARAMVVASFHFTPTEIARRLGVGRKVVYDALNAAHAAERGGDDGK
jgi:hypothetical protein